LHEQKEREAKQKSFFARKFTDREENPKLQIHGLIGRKLHSESSNPKLTIHSFVKNQPKDSKVTSDDSGRIHSFIGRSFHGDPTGDDHKKIVSLIGRSFHGESSNSHKIRGLVSNKPFTPIHGRNFRGEPEDPSAKIGKKSRRL